MEQAGFFSVDWDVSLETLAPEQGAEQPLAPEEIAKLREQLVHLREWLLQSIARLENQAQPGVSRMVAVDGDDVAWQMSINQRSLADKRLLLNEVARAFERMEDNTYGRCVADDSLIPRSLLEEMPWARFCERCAARHG